MLENIGFYTLSNERARTAGVASPLSRCELLLTAACNFKCPYCRGVGGKGLPYHEAESIVQGWADQGLKAIRFSGGEPLCYPNLIGLVRLAKERGIPRIAISTNGSFCINSYIALLDAGVNDFSISLDACCAEDGDRMAGGVKGSWARVTANIATLSKLTYVTVGVVLTEDNGPSITEIIKFADTLGVSDIRIIPAAQQGVRLDAFEVSDEILQKYPILRYRVGNLREGRQVRGLREQDSFRCGLVLDDMAVCEGKHYPCIIYLREGGKEIGAVGPNMRQEREEWFQNHNTQTDFICRHNCLDVCVDYNNTFERLNCRSGTPVCSTGRPGEPGPFTKLSALSCSVERQTLPVLWGERG